MKNSQKIMIVAVVLLLIGGVFALTSRSAKSPTSSNSTTSSESATSAGTISYTDSGFEPNSINVKSGTTITIKNNSKGLLQFSSSPHPQHSDDTELNMSTLSPGGSRELKVTETGTHGFHNHLNSEHTGTLIVN